MIQLSPTAIGEVKRLRRKQSPGIPRLPLRIDVVESGCKGLSYQLGFVEAPQPEDLRFACEGDIEVVVTPASFACLQGLVLDYTEDLMGGGFRFYNPNATVTCSCGHSFAIDAVDV